MSELVKHTNDDLLHITGKIIRVDKGAVGDS